MNRTIRAGERWVTFVFDGIDCADLGVYSITNSGTYTTNLTPSFTDKLTTVTAYDGQYYYGTQITGQKFTMNMFAENLTYSELCHLKAWLNPRHIGKIIFSDQPYKYYYVKPTSVSTLNNIPLSTVQTPERSILGDFLEGDPVYTGKFTITFVTVGSAYAYGLSYYRDDLVYDAVATYGIDVYPENYYYDSGLLYKDVSPKMKWNIKENDKAIKIPAYNPGDAPSYPVFRLTLDNDSESKRQLVFSNNTTRETCIVNLQGITGEAVIDFTSQAVKTFKEDGSAINWYGRMTGNVISLTEKSQVISIPDTLTVDEEDYYKTEYDTIYVQHAYDDELQQDVAVVTINSMVLQVNSSWIGKYFCINHNGGARIINVLPESNQLILENEPYTYDINPAEKDEKGNIITHAGFPCNYIEVYNNENNIPKNPQVGDVYQIDDVWYIYRYGEWQETKLFTHINQFKDIKGKLTTQYLLCGANVLELNDLEVKAVNMPEFVLSIEILPRYL
jgi:phage-related protein